MVGRRLPARSRKTERIHPHKHSETEGQCKDLEPEPARCLHRTLRSPRVTAEERSYLRPNPEVRAGLEMRSDFLLSGMESIWNL